MPLEIVLSLLLGFAIGIFSGLLGLGGGIFIVPALNLLFTYQGVGNETIMHLSTGTSLAAMVFTTAMVTWSYYQRGSVKWPLLKLFLPGLLIGVLIGTVLGKQITTANLKLFFASFLLLLAIRIIFAANKPQKIVKKTPCAIVLFFLAVCAGTLAGLLGIGGGVLLIPIFLAIGLATAQAGATSAACAFPTALTGALAAIATGWQVEGLPAFCLGYVNWAVALSLGATSMLGAPIGVYLAHHLPGPIIKRIFGFFLLLMAWQILPTNILRF